MCVGVCVCIKAVDKSYFVWNDLRALQITWIKFRYLIHTPCVWIMSRVWGLAHKALLSFTPSFSCKLIAHVLFFLCQMYLLPHVLQNFKVLSTHGALLQAHSSTWSVIFHPSSPTDKLTQTKDEKVIGASFWNNFQKTFCVLDRIVYVIFRVYVWVCTHANVYHMCVFLCECVRTEIKCAFFSPEFLYDKASSQWISS